MNVTLHKKLIVEEMNPQPALFLDRDGVINKRLPGDYVSTLEEFQFCEGSLAALKELSLLFSPIVVVTNQAGIGKGLMTTDQLMRIHAYMLQQITEAGGRIERVYFCPNRSEDAADCRKPNIGMGLQAKKEFPMLQFNTAWIVGDSISDMEFGQRLGMKTALVEGKEEELALQKQWRTDWKGDSLWDFSQFIKLHVG